MASLALQWRGLTLPSSLCFSARSLRTPGLRAVQAGFSRNSYTSDSCLSLPHHLRAYLPTMLQFSTFLFVIPHILSMAKLLFAKQINTTFHSVGDQLPPHLPASMASFVTIQIFF